VPNQPDPRYLSKQKVTTDVFTLSFQSVENFAAVLNELTDATFREQLGRGGVTLKFNGLLGLGSVQAIPTRLLAVPASPTGGPRVGVRADAGVASDLQPAGVTPRSGTPFSAARSSGGVW